MNLKKWLVLIMPILLLLILILAYNMFRFPAMFRNLKDESLSEDKVNALVEEMKQKDELKVLVAYFSYSGTTENVAKSLSSKINADLFKIEPKKEYKNVYIEGNNEIRFNKKPELKSTILEDYDVVFVGFPIWFHATPAPINTFLESYDLKGKLIIPFCTSGGSDISEAMPTFLNSSKDLAIYKERRIINTNVLDDWLEEIGLFKK